MTQFASFEKPVVTTGTSTAYQLDLPSLSAMTDFAMLVNFHIACGDTPTIQINAFWAKAIKDSSGLALSADDIKADDTLNIMFDMSKDCFEIIGSLWGGWGGWDWSDWDVTINTTVTLTRDMYYNNLTITSPGILIPNWYRVFVAWTLSGNGKIQRNWLIGNNGAWATWWVWVIMNQGSLNAELLSGHGWQWSTWAFPSNGSAGANGVSANPSYSTINWVAGGNWGSVWGWFTVWIWWTGGISTRWILYNIASLKRMYEIIWPASVSFPTTQYMWISSSGWGWGGNYFWWGWASWGSNGWLIRLAVNILNRTWTFESIGWDWGIWNNGIWGWIWGGWWGWWGGNWWVVIVIYWTLTSLWSSTLTWWNGGLWGYTFTGWTETRAPSWVNWNAWVLIQIAV